MVAKRKNRVIVTWEEDGELNWEFKLGDTPKHATPASLLRDLIVEAVIFAASFKVTANRLSKKDAAKLIKAVEDIANKLGG